MITVELMDPVTLWIDGAPLRAASPRWGRLGYPVPCLWLGGHGAVRARAKALGVAIPRGSDAALLRLALAVAERAPESAWRGPERPTKRAAKI